MDGDNTQPPQQGQENGSWQYKSEDFSAPASLPGTQDTPSPANDTIEWTASEFVAHDKGFGWYAVLAIGAVGISALMYLVTRDMLSTMVIILFAVVLGVAGARKPRVVTYRLSASGIKIGAKFHAYGEYKSFALREEQPFASIEFIPMKRFGLPLSIYLAPENEHEVLDALSNRLPLERGKPDNVEQLMRYLRF